MQKGKGFLQMAFENEKMEKLGLQTVAKALRGLSTGNALIGSGCLLQETQWTWAEAKRSLASAPEQSNLEYRLNPS